MLNSYDCYIYNDNSINLEIKTRTDFALGFGLSSKWSTEKGFIFEIIAGVGQNLFNSSDTVYEIVCRGGVKCWLLVKKNIKGFSIEKPFNYLINDQTNHRTYYIFINQFFIETSFSIIDFNSSIATRSCFIVSL